MELGNSTFHHEFLHFDWPVEKSESYEKDVKKLSKINQKLCGALHCKSSDNILHRSAFLNRKRRKNLNNYETCVTRIEVVEAFAHKSLFSVH